MITHRFQITWSSAGAALNGTREVNQGEEHNLSETLAHGTNVALPFTLDVSRTKCLFLVCDKDIVIKTNNSGSPANTFTLTAGEPFVWMGGGTLTDTVGTTVVDVTSLFYTLAEENDGALLQLRSLLDLTE